MTAYNQDGPEITLKASGDLSAKQFYIMTLDTDGKVKTGDDADDPAEPMLGVLQNKPSVEDQAAVVRVDGAAKVVGGAALDEGTWVTCDANGKAVASVANDNDLGFLLTACGADGEMCVVMLKQGSGHVVPA